MQLARAREPDHPEDAIRIHEREVEALIDKKSAAGYRDAVKLVKVGSNAPTRSQCSSTRSTSSTERGASIRIACGAVNSAGHRRAARDRTEQTIWGHVSSLCNPDMADRTTVIIVQAGGDCAIPAANAVPCRLSVISLSMRRRTVLHRAWCRHWCRSCSEWAGQDGSRRHERRRESPCHPYCTGVDGTRRSRHWAGS